MSINDSEILKVLEQFRERRSRYPLLSIKDFKEIINSVKEKIASSYPKNVIPAKAGIQKACHRVDGDPETIRKKALDARFRGHDRRYYFSKLDTTL